MKIRTKKAGEISHGFLEGHPEVDERGLTEDIARKKVERLRMARMEPTRKCIAALVIASRRILKRPVRATVLFDVEGE